MKQIISESLKKCVARVAMLYLFKVINLRSFANNTQVITEKAIRQRLSSSSTWLRIWEPNETQNSQKKGKDENQLYTDLSD